MWLALLSICYSHSERGASTPRSHWVRTQRKMRERLPNSREYVLLPKEKKKIVDCVSFISISYSGKCSKFVADKKVLKAIVLWAVYSHVSFYDKKLPLTFYMWKYGRESRVYALRFLPLSIFMMKVKLVQCRSKNCRKLCQETQNWTSAVCSPENPRPASVVHACYRCSDYPQP